MEEDEDVKAEKNQRMNVVRDTMVHELKALAHQGMVYKNKIRSAKTKPKKALYEKKLARNSKSAAEMILALERLEKTTGTQDNPTEQEFIDVAEDRE